MTKTTLDKLTNDVRKFRDARDWKQFHNPKDLAIALVLESTEVLEHMQWLTGAELRQRLNKRHKQVAHELADVLHLLLLLADDLEVDLVKAFDQKMRVNKRKYPIHKARGSPKKYTEL